MDHRGQVDARRPARSPCGGPGAWGRRPRSIWGRPSIHRVTRLKEDSRGGPESRGGGWAGGGTRSRRDPRCLRAQTRMSITARTRRQHAVHVRIPVSAHVPTSRPGSSALMLRACLQACVCRPGAGPGPTNAPRLVCGSHVHIRGQQAPLRELVTARGLHGNPPSPAHDSMPCLGS